MAKRYTKPNPSRGNTSKPENFKFSTAGTGEGQIKGNVSKVIGPKSATSFPDHGKVTGENIGPARSPYYQATKGNGR